jgi:hypothetical protein
VKPGLQPSTLRALHYQAVHEASGNPFVEAQTLAVERQILSSYGGFHFVAVTSSLTRPHLDAIPYINFGSSSDLENSDDSSDSDNPNDSDDDTNNQYQ